MGFLLPYDPETCASLACFLEKAAEIKLFGTDWSPRAHMSPFLPPRRLAGVLAAPSVMRETWLLSVSLFSHAQGSVVFPSFPPRVTRSPFISELASSSVMSSQTIPGLPAYRYHSRLSPGFILSFPSNCPLSHPRRHQNHNLNKSFSYYTN